MLICHPKMIINAVFCLPIKVKWIKVNPPFDYTLI